MEREIQGRTPRGRRPTDQGSPRVRPRARASPAARPPPSAIPASTAAKPLPSRPPSLRTCALMAARCWSQLRRHYVI
jgi:hypothetical protein